MRLLPFLLFVLPRAIDSQFNLDQQEAGGVYSRNYTLYQRNGPFLVSRDIVIEAGVTFTIETGSEIRFKPGVGIKVHGTLYAVVRIYKLNEFILAVDKFEKIKYFRPGKIQ